MARLRAAAPRLAAGAPRLGRAPGDERARDRERAATSPGRSWYNTQRWRQLRLEVLRRDGWTCRQTGVLLTGRNHAPDSPVIDHIVPHRGDPELFWDIENLQAVSKAWHDSEKQRQERGEK